MRCNVVHLPLSPPLTYHCHPQSPTTVTLSHLPLSPSVTHLPPPPPSIYHCHPHSPNYLTQIPYHCHPHSGGFAYDTVKEHHYLAWGKVVEEADLQLDEKRAADDTPVRSISRTDSLVSIEGTEGGYGEHPGEQPREHPTHDGLSGATATAGMSASHSQSQSHGQSHRTPAPRPPHPDPGYEVVMGGAESFGVGGLMYVVFVVDLSSLDPADESAMDLVGQAASQVGCYASLQDIKDMWATGGDGLCLFHTDDDKFNLALAASSPSPSPSTTPSTFTSTFPYPFADPLREVGLTDWSEEVTLGIVSASKKSFQIVHKATGRAEQLAYSVSPLPGLFSRTKVVRAAPLHPSTPTPLHPSTIFTPSPPLPHLLPSHPLPLPASLLPHPPTPITPHTHPTPTPRSTSCPTSSSSTISKNLSRSPTNPPLGEGRPPSPRGTPRSCASPPTNPPLGTKSTTSVAPRCTSGANPVCGATAASI